MELRTAHDLVDALASLLKAEPDDVRFALNEFVDSRVDLHEDGWHQNA